MSNERISCDEALRLIEACGEEMRRPSMLRSRPVLVPTLAEKIAHWLDQHAAHVESWDHAGVEMAAWLNAGGEVPVESICAMRDIDSAPYL